MYAKQDRNSIIRRGETGFTTAQLNSQRTKICDIFVLLEFWPSRYRGVAADTPRLKSVGPIQFLGNSAYGSEIPQFIFSKESYLFAICNFDAMSDNLSMVFSKLHLTQKFKV